MTLIPDTLDEDDAQLAPHAVANPPAALFGDHLANKWALRIVHAITAAIFARLGVATLMRADENYGV